MLNYLSLPRHDRRAAKKLAKQLLRTVPAAQKAEEPSSVRGKLNTAFMKPKNVIGAFVYSDGNGNWWGDVVFRKGEKCSQIGSAEDSPAQPPENALEDIKAVIAMEKAMREHPFVGELRAKGCDPEQVELLRVGHASLGHRWVIMDEEQIQTGAEAYVTYLQEKLPNANKIEHARTFVLQTAPRFATGPMFLNLEDDQNVEEGAFQLLNDAAAFLLSCGVINVDQYTADPGLLFVQQQSDATAAPTLN
jgi:hypothetical protein